MRHLEIATEYIVTIEFLNTILRLYERFEQITDNLPSSTSFSYKLDLLGDSLIDEQNTVPFIGQISEKQFDIIISNASNLEVIVDLDSFWNSEIDKIVKEFNSSGINTEYLAYSLYIMTLSNIINRFVKIMNDIISKSVYESSYTLNISNLVFNLIVSVEKHILIMTTELKSNIDLTNNIQTKSIDLEKQWDEKRLMMRDNILKMLT